MEKNMIKLAIIIPYFKIKYFEQTLLSIHNQTDKRFKIYIGNDNSPECPINLINKIFCNQENIFYKRFNTNLGSVQLTRHWERCINLSDEEYIWLFSDDDLMPEDAVERFYNSFQLLPGTDLFRFNIRIINDSNKIVFPESHHPIHETAFSFLNRRLNGEVISSACEYIFSRQIYLTRQGFVEFPLAWASDDATWLNYSNDRGIFLIPGNCVSWRMGGTNISSETANYKLKSSASIAFIQFINSKYSVNNHLKLKWLIGQISLLGNSKKMKLYFWSLIITKKIFPFSFIVASFKKITSNLVS